MFLGSGLDAAKAISLLDTAYDDKVMSARIMRVVITRGAYVDDRSMITYDLPSGTYDVTVWQWPRGKKRTQALSSFGDRLTGNGTSPDDDSIFEPYPYVTEV